MNSFLIGKRVDLQSDVSNQMTTAMLIGHTYELLASDLPPQSKNHGSGKFVGLVSLATNEAKGVSGIKKSLPQHRAGISKVADTSRL